jgi:hypothetical protein
MCHPRSPSHQRKNELSHQPRDPLTTTSETHAYRLFSHDDEFLARLDLDRTLSMLLPGVLDEAS